jgi:hypothetical protein
MRKIVKNLRKNQTQNLGKAFGSASNRFFTLLSTGLRKNPPQRSHTYIQERIFLKSSMKMVFGMKE